MANAEQDDPKGDEAEGAPEQATSEAAPVEEAAAGKAPLERGAVLRRALLAKLPRLSYEGNIADAVRMDADTELRSLVDLEVDALLEPLRRLAPRRGNE